LNEALSPPFDPHVGWPQQEKLGDYYDMVSQDSVVHVAYAATFNGEQDVYYLRIDKCFGDLDGDGDVDLSDLAVLLSNYGTPSGAAYEDGYLDGDGDVDLTDLAALLAVYGATCP
jgi:hypothetical protein